MNTAVFLDRDGVINKAIIRDRKAYAPTTLDRLEILPKVKEALEALKKAGYKRIVVTNQPDVKKGLVKAEIIEAINREVMKKLPLDEIRACFHVDADNCSCRKPKPGMLLDAASKWSLDLKRCFMIGDRWRDIDAGKSAGCKTIWIKSDYDEKEPEKPDAVCDSLWEASQLILGGKL